MAPGAYRPFVPARRPGGKPPDRPRYRVLVHRSYLDLWEQLAERVGMESAQRFYDYVSSSPGQPPPVGRTAILFGKAGWPIADGFSRTIHYEISGAGRINFQYNDSFQGGALSDPHAVVCILTIDLSSH